MSGNQTIDYGFCPPTSGSHYNAAGRGPIPAQVYPATEVRAPGGWVHNLEHGWIVVLYRASGPDDMPTAQEMADMQAFFDRSPVVNNCPKQVIVARFDDMDTRFAELAWGRALLTNEFNVDTALTFAQQWMDHPAVPEAPTC